MKLPIQVKPVSRDSLEKTYLGFQAGIQASTNGLQVPQQPTHLSRPAQQPQLSQNCRNCISQQTGQGLSYGRALEVCLPIC